MRSAALLPRGVLGFSQSPASEPRASSSLPALIAFLERRLPSRGVGAWAAARGVDPSDTPR